MSWISDVYECHLCTALTWSDLNPACILNLYSLRAACCWWLVCSCHDKQEVSCRACFNLSRLRSGCWRCSLAVGLHCPSPTLVLSAWYMRTLNFREIFKCAFKIYGIWPQASKHTHALPQFSHASVGLAQAHPNNSRKILNILLKFYHQNHSRISFDSK